MTDPKKTEQYIPTHITLDYINPKTTLERHGVTYTPLTSIFDYMAPDKERLPYGEAQPSPAVLEEHVDQLLQLINVRLHTQELHVSLYMQVFGYNRGGALSLSLYALNTHVRNFPDLTSLIHYLVLLLGIKKCQELGFIKVHTY